MSLVEKLIERSGNKCELCNSSDHLQVFTVEPGNSTVLEQNVYICGTCTDQINHPEKINSNHWRCLNESIWSEIQAVQVLSWRMLNRLQSESWSRDLLEMLYLDDEVLTWAKALGDGRETIEETKHIDSNGSVLENGDTVVLIKDLEVKGANFTAKRGTSVRNIRLVHDNPEQIEGKVNGQGIVILTQYVKK